MQHVARSQRRSRASTKQTRRRWKPSAEIEPQHKHQVHVYFSNLLLRGLDHSGAQAIIGYILRLGVLFGFLLLQRTAPSSLVKSCHGCPQRHKPCGRKTTWPQEHLKLVSILTSGFLCLDASSSYMHKAGIGARFPLRSRS